MWIIYLAKRASWLPIRFFLNRIPPPPFHCMHNGSTSVCDNKRYVRRERERASSRHHQKTHCTHARNRVVHYGAKIWWNYTSHNRIAKWDIGLFHLLFEYVFEYYSANCVGVLPPSRFISPPHILRQTLKVNLTNKTWVACSKNDIETSIKYESNNINFMACCNLYFASKFYGQSWSKIRGGLITWIEEVHPLLIR